jgi:hypothetical protein
MSSLTEEIQQLQLRILELEKQKKEKDEIDKKTSINHNFKVLNNVLIENINFTINIISKQEETEAIVLKINTIYKEIKKNEESPKTDYLFNNLNKSNLEKTMEKIDLMNNF